MTNPQMKRPTTPETAVPSGRFSRLASLGKLATVVAGAMVTEGVRQLSTGQRPNVKNLLLTPANIQRLTDQLSQMRGAAMKVGQLLSMDGGELLPPELTKILSKLRSDARPMPKNQLISALNRSWGPGWEKKFKSFSYTPLAAASIGQVHLAVMHDGRQLAIKVQYPGVRQSIRSDIDNIAVILKVSNLIPRGIDINPLLEEAKRQLQEEADYLKESAHILRYRELLADSPEFVIPELFAELTTKDVLAMSFVSGKPLESLKTAPQKERDRVMSKLFELLFREMFEFNCIQTDPNFANYLYDEENKKIVLLDFGATRVFDAQRIQAYRRLMTAGMHEDPIALENAALDIGYFSTSMKQAHKRLVLKILMQASEPLRHQGSYPCGEMGLSGRMNESTSQLGTDRTFSHIAPTETVFLHRKVGGIYMLAVQLKAHVDIGSLFLPFAIDLKTTNNKT
jgi:predicted unusual protein kinase regulating ubiquinone biosynthesis (AarF/ABC1/UbiB family)